MALATKVKPFPMRISPYLFTLAVFAFTTARAQYYEAGMSIGAANYSGELTAGGFQPSGYRPAFGLFGRYNHSPRLAAKAVVTLGQIAGSDGTSGNAANHARNLEFRSSIYEVAALGEFNLMPYAIRNNQGAALYLTGGLAGFYFNPQTPFHGSWVNLQPLGTEGQGSPAAPSTKRYSRFALAIPFGAGAKINVTDRFNIGFEVLVRRTFTDYLDDVSGAYPDIEKLYAADPLAATLSYRTPEYLGSFMPNPVGIARGNAKVKDYYMTAQLTLSWNLTFKQGLDFDQKYDIFKDPPPAVGTLLEWRNVPQA